MSKKFAFVLMMAVLLLSSSLAFALPPDRASLPRTLDEEFVRMADAIPGFGGLFYDKDGYANVYVKKGEAGAAVLRKMNDEVRILEGLYDFKELAEWRGELNSLLNMPGMVLLDVDETRNVIRIGVDRKAAGKRFNVERLERQLLTKRVPREAIVIEEVDPIVPLVTLREAVRPIPGGMQIAFGGFLCTLGFNATRGGVAGFVTNSHCTNVQGGVESTRYAQPSGATLATEIADPTYFTGSGCPVGRRCRRSDSSFARYDSSTTGIRGRIARTTSRGASIGSITINASSPNFFITSETPFPTAGQAVNRVGRTNGWTFGIVTGTCTNINVSGTTITQLCQDLSNFGSAGGDSGSPVFSWPGSGSNVSLMGIMWGGGGGTSVFSAMSNIEGELGALTTF